MRLCRRRDGKALPYRCGHQNLGEVTLRCEAQPLTSLKKNRPERHSLSALGSGGAAVLGLYNSADKMPASARIMRALLTNCASTCWASNRGISFYARLSGQQAPPNSSVVKVTD